MKKAIIVLFFMGFINLNAQLQTVSYMDQSQQLKGLYASPDKPLPGSPGVLILPAWMGITQHEKDVAIELSKLGYRAFIADIYGVGNYPKDQQEAGKLASKYKNDRESYRRRIALALDQLPAKGADKLHLAAIGYCFGGTGVLEMARSGMPVKGVVSLHGGLAKDASGKEAGINTRVLALHGADDPFVKPEEVAAFEQEMRNAKADWQLVSYGNAVHAFTEKGAGSDNSKGAAYNALADARSKKAMLNFLEEIFAR